MSKEKLRVCVFLEEEEKQEKQVDSKSGEGGEGRREGRQRAKKRRQAVVSWAAME